MGRYLAAVPLLVAFLAFGAAAQEKFEVDIIKTSGGDLRITFIGHASLMFAFGGKIIHVDPFGRLTDYARLPKADLILVTHAHGDHLDPKAIGALRTGGTRLVLNGRGAEKVKGGAVIRNGETKIVAGLRIEAVPAYNLVHMRGPGQPFHPKGAGNSYVITFGDVRVFIGGDTENVPEMKSLEGIDIAFLPMNLPYTMTPEMVADAAKAFRPKILYPYHTGKTDISRLLALMKGAGGIEVRVRKMP